MKAPSDKGPKSVKVFINQPRTLDFDQAAGNASIQDLELVLHIMRTEFVMKKVKY